MKAFYLQKVVSLSVLLTLSALLTQILFTLLQNKMERSMLSTRLVGYYPKMRSTHKLKI